MQNNRNDAKRSGDKYYFTGVPCAHGHLCNRFTSTRACKECLAVWKAKYRENEDFKSREIAYGRQYKERNKQTMKEKRLQKYQVEGEKMRQSARAWKERNKERNAEYGSRYKRSKPAENAARARLYESSKLQATPIWADLEEIIKIYKQARALSEQTGLTYDVDHIYPLRGKNVCGLHVPQNLRAIPSRLNRKKYNKHPEEFAQTLTPG